MSRVGLKCVILVFPVHTHLLLNVQPRVGLNLSLI